MSNAPHYSIDVDRFWQDPYPDLAIMRQQCPIAYVPELGATLITRRNDIVNCEKNVSVFSSCQPEGLMTRLMGENLMRKDGDAHMAERKANYPCFSPKTVRTVWRDQFRELTNETLSRLKSVNSADLFREYAMVVSADALRAMTGLTNLTALEMNDVSQGMIDGCANYIGNQDVEARCHECTARIDQAIDEKWEAALSNPDYSQLSVQRQAGLSETQTRANIKLSISGGQNEPRDAIAGTIWALLAHPEQLEKVITGEADWSQAFEEYARWISPIGMSPRRIARQHEHSGVTFEPEDRVFLMFSSGNRDSAVFENADSFDVTRDTSASVSFGAGPHFCAGAWASRALIAEFALPVFFGGVSNPRLSGDVPFGGWAFRGPLALPCEWHD